MKKFNLFKMLAVLIVLITSINTAWAADAGFFDKKQWNVQYWDGSSNQWTGGNDGHDNETTVNLGVKTTLYIKACWVKTWSTNDWNQNKVVWYFDHSTGYYNNVQDNKSNAHGDQTWSFSTNWNAIEYAPNKPGANTIYMYWKLDDSKSATASYINYTIPGFTTSTASKSFGTSVPINTESETTISFTHHGDAPGVGDCEITGDDADDFEVISISNSGVNVIFTPTSTGPKTATLTITDSYSTDYSTIEITLTGTAVANTTATTLYFNDYTNNGDWSADGALYRFTCAYTEGVYTHYNMTKCANTEHTYSAEVELKSVTPSIDRYNPSSPHNTWNSASPSLSASNPYAISSGKYTAYATNHPFNDVTGGTFYYDNSKSLFTNTLYLVVGHDHQISNDGSNKYSSATSLSYILNTKLYYSSSYAGAGWHDADYYGVIAASSAPEGTSWGSDDLDDKGTSGYTAAYKELLGLLTSNTYLGFAATSGGALNISTSPTLNTTQTFKYALSTDGGGTYTAMTSGAPNTPGQLSMSAYQFTSAACTAVEAKSAQTLSANATTYSKEVSNVAYTGTTTLTASEKRDGYTFVGWYNTTTGSPTLRTSNASFTYYPQGDSTYTAYYKAHRYTINFDANDAQYSSAPAATGTMDPMTNVVYDQSATLTANGFHRIGYKFEGWATTAGGPVVYADEATDILNLTTTDGGSATLYAKWSTDVNTFTNAGGNGAWDNEANWYEGKVPENDDATITINQPVTISGGSYHIGELSFGASGSLTIAADGALEVAGTITNTDASKIVINSTTTNQGALIFNSTGSTAATVNMTMNAADDRFQFIAIPVPYINVADKFSGSTVYTYGWSNTKHEWERRGYYDGFSSFEAVLVKGQGSALFSGNLVETGNRVCGGSYAESYGNVYMYGNSWTAPITMSAEGFSNASIGIMNRTTNGWDGVVAGDVIPALQAFGVAVNYGGGSITINYDRDVRNPSTPNVPLKAPKHQMSETQEPITVYVSGNEMQTRIRLFEDATRFSDEFDNGWEALYMEGYGYAGEMYAMGTDKMNVLATNNLEGTIVGFVPGQAENYTISFAGDGKGYYLNDMKEEESTLIEEGNTYVFTPDESTNSARFVISKTPIAKTPTSVDNINDGVRARKQMIDGTLYIIRDGRIYNAEGRLVK